MITSISLAAKTLDALAARGPNRSYVVARDLERLYTLYSHALRDVALNIHEACLLVDALQDHTLDANSADLLWMAVSDADRERDLGGTWGVDMRALGERLSDLDRLHALAILDAVERFWLDPSALNGPTDEVVAKYFPIDD